MIEEMKKEYESIKRKYRNVKNTTEVKNKGLARMKAMVFKRDETRRYMEDAHGKLIVINEKGKIFYDKCLEEYRSLEQELEVLTKEEQEKKKELDSMEKFHKEFFELTMIRAKPKKKKTEVENDEVRSEDV